MESIKYEIKTEMHVREYFAIHAGELGYSILVSRSGYPDYLLEDTNRKTHWVEVEYESANFISHGHDPAKCDFILCWIHTQAVPLPVLELSVGKMHEPNAEPTVKREREVKQKSTEDELDTKRIKEVVKKHPDLYSAFMVALVEDLRAQRKYDDLMRGPRMRLLAANELLLRAVQEEAGLYSTKIHPYDLLQMLS